MNFKFIVWKMEVCYLLQYSSAEKLSWGFDYLKPHSFAKKSISEEMYKCSGTEELFSATLKPCELRGWSYLNHALHKHLQADRMQRICFSDSFQWRPHCEWVSSENKDGQVHATK